MKSFLRCLLPYIDQTPLMPPEPEGVLSMVGDVHGCVRQLKTLLQRLPGQIVLVGDLIDRGEEAPAVLELLMACPEILCLRGNHEEMLLAFLDDPARHGAAWLHYGGLQTLAGYGVGGDLFEAELPRLRDRLMQAMGEATVAWLRARPAFYLSGNVAVTHAGADPARPIDQQDQTLVWGHANCGRIRRRDGLWVVHGHVIVPVPDIRQGVIRVDTGAYTGGPLTAAILGDGDLRFDSVR